MTNHSALLQPSAWVRRFAPLIPQGEVLDLACGHGRHARYFAAAGHAVLAVDRDDAALAMIQQDHISIMRVDLEGGAPWPFEKDRFSGIVITNYLHRPLFSYIFESLLPGGVLIVETFAQGNGLFGKPSNPDFLLAAGELLELARICRYPLKVIAFEDGYVDHPKPAMVQRICLVKPAFGVELRRFALN